MYRGPVRAIVGDGEVLDIRLSLDAALASRVSSLVRVFFSVSTTSSLTDDLISSPSAFHLEARFFVSTAFDDAVDGIVD